MIVIDLTQKLTENMPLFPGTPNPRLEVIHTVEADGFREMELSLYSHMGTHLDTPAHVFHDGKTLDDYPVDRFCGRGLVLDFVNCREKLITIELFEQALKAALLQLESPGTLSRENRGKREENLLSSVDFLLFYTGWDKKWGEESYFAGAPALSEEVAGRVVTLNVKGVGIDALSIDPLQGNMLLAHRILLKNDIIIVENLKNLGELLGKDFEFYGLPLRIDHGEGSPIRGIAKLR